VDFDHPMAVGHSRSNPELYFEFVFEFGNAIFFTIVLFVEGSYEDSIVVSRIRVKALSHKRLTTRVRIASRLPSEDGPITLCEYSN